MTQRILHGLPWITIFGSRVRRFANNFHGWRSHEWKSLANCITSDTKNFIHGNECFILFLTRYLMSWTLNSAKTIIEYSDNLKRFTLTFVGMRTSCVVEWQPNIVWVAIWRHFRVLKRAAFRSNPTTFHSFRKKQCHPGPALKHWKSIMILK